MWPHSGDWDIEYPFKDVSVAFVANSILTRHSTDEEVIPAVSSSGTLYGIGLKTVTSASDDYATADTRIPVAVPRSDNSLFKADTNSDIAITDEGELMDLSDHLLVNPAATTEKVVQLVKFVSARVGIFRFTRRDGSSTPLAT